MGQLLSKDAIFAAADVVTEDVAVPEWGGTVRVRALSGRERDAFEASITEQKGKKTTVKLVNIRARLVALSVIDEKGERLFDDSEIGRLGEKNAAALDRIFDVARRLSGLSDEDVEELEGNSEATHSADSPTD